MHRAKKINIMITKESQLYNPFNNSKLSNELGEYIYSQFKGIPLKKDVVLSIHPNFKMTDSEKRKLVNEIRENFGLNIRENILTLQFQRIKELVILFIGLSLIAIAHLLVANYYYNLQQFLSIFGWVLVYECFSCFSFINTKLRYENKKYVKLIKSKIIFTEHDDNLK